MRFFQRLRLLAMGTRICCVSCVKMGWGKHEMNKQKSSGPQAPMDTETTPRKTSAKLGRDVQAKIGQQLRAMYDDVLKQGVPDRFADLLNRLDKPADKDR